ncbi:conserved hypothetical protein [Talaromyces stipitatus ATCC 10500]|uniref:Uncharacterized protein n=1 Tax=Talaromyces stipitatus (strain ATCC 10500 / CBS 375.48 / QM 6759 / NRRL 1006) TaxID=441959 RepID=B8MDL1_TALSN|nr:uncharacterized protein TSTA_117510 [Talaromyces stipitatus ATCC 10500]EED17974.1 conserved hypothetical protein [Talaromyces stipitatus ATCC 10500]
MEARSTMISTDRNDGSPSQPVLVRAYTPETNNARSSTKMSSNPTAQQIDLPPVEEFGIDAILRAIEPDIRSTLDSIAEICGRSKLSLANEYGSHIAPFGEVNAPPGNLLAIQETAADNAESSTDVDGHIVIVDDDNHLYDSPLGLLDDLRQTALATGYQQTSRAVHEGDVSDPRTGAARHGKNPEHRTQASAFPATRMNEFAVTSKSASTALLGYTASKTKATKSSTTTSPALLSEIRLYAQGNRSSWPSVPPDTPKGSPVLHASSFTGNASRTQNTVADRISFLAEVQDWLNWLKSVVQRETANQVACSHSYSAENSLRALLVRDQDHGVPVPTA